jgi:hypothetical protein
MLSKSHRVRDNLLGTGRFCPIIRRTPALSELLDLDLSVKAPETIGRTGAHLIEGERPPRNRLERWGHAILQAGKHPLTLDEIVRLQRVLIEDTRFVREGLRPDGVFLGERDHNGDPLPNFIGDRASDR